MQDGGRLWCRMMVGRGAGWWLGPVRRKDIIVLAPSYLEDQAAFIDLWDSLQGAAACGVHTMTCGAGVPLEGVTYGGSHPHSPHMITVAGFPLHGDVWGWSP